MKILRIFLYVVSLVIAVNSHAQIVSEVKFQTIEKLHWSQIAKAPVNSVLQQNLQAKATLFLPNDLSKKYPAMVLVHGIGGLYNKAGEKRSYWGYAEFLAKNGVGVILVDTHGTRNHGSLSNTSQTSVPVFGFVADAYAAADFLSTHPNIDEKRIGVFGFSKGGTTVILSADKRTTVLSKRGINFKTHVAIYPGCQTFMQEPQLTGSPLTLIIGKKDTYTGTSGCYEIQKNYAASTKLEVIELDATHSWDENIGSVKVDDLSSEKCRFYLQNDGSEKNHNGQTLSTVAENKSQITPANNWESCLVKRSDIYITYNKLATEESKKIVLRKALSM
jgi:dienelactone hydrolase